MTILVRVRNRGWDLTVCGTPSKAWLDWLLTAEVPLTSDQLHWRALHAQSTGYRPPGRRVPDWEPEEEPDAEAVAPLPAPPLAAPAAAVGPRVWPPPGVAGRWGAPRGAAQDGAGR